MGDSEETKEQTVQLINDLQDINLLKIVIIFAAAWLIIFVSRKVLPYLAQRGPSQLRLYILNAVPIIRLSLLTLAILWVFPIVFNVTYSNFLVIAGGASVAIGFAFKDYVSSLIAGIVATFERPYRPGDWIEIEGDYGEVKSIGMRALSIVTASDDVITVPHTRIWDQNISNSNDGERTLMCVVDFYLEMHHNCTTARDVLRDVALTSGYLEYAKPVTVTLSNQPWGTHYKVKAYPFDMRDQFEFISDITERGKIALAAAGLREVSVPMAHVEAG